MGGSCRLIRARVARPDGQPVDDREDQAGSGDLVAPDLQRDQTDQSDVHQILGNSHAPSVHTARPHDIAPRVDSKVDSVSTPTQPLAGQSEQLPVLKTTMDNQAQTRSVPSIRANTTSCEAGVGWSWDHSNGTGLDT